jgi:hypothetical protein
MLKHAATRLTSVATVLATLAVAGSVYQIAGLSYAELVVSSK